MAATKISGGWELHTVGDTIVNCRATGIFLVVGAAAGTTTLKLGGVSGTPLITTNPVTDDTTSYTFAGPQYLPNLYLSAVGTNVSVVVLTC